MSLLLLTFLPPLGALGVFPCVSLSPPSFPPPSKHRSTAGTSSVRSPVFHPEPEKLRPPRALPSRAPGEELGRGDRKPVHWQGPRPGEGELLL